MDVEFARDVPVEAAKAAGALIRDGAAGKTPGVVLPVKGMGGDIVTNLEPTAGELRRRAHPPPLPLARESGIAICGLDGTPFDERLEVGIERRSFVAGRPEVLDDLLDWARQSVAIRRRLAILLRDS
jgi:hypothetical protein